MLVYALSQLLLSMFNTMLYGLALGLGFAVGKSFLEKKTK